MAPSAITPDALAALDEIKAPAGVVLPPKEIKGQRPPSSARTTPLDNLLTFIQPS